MQKNNDMKSVFGSKLKVASSFPQDDIEKEQIHPTKSIPTCFDEECDQICTFKGECIDPYTCFCHSNEYNSLVQKKNPQIVDIDSYPAVMEQKFADSIEKEALISFLDGIYIYIHVFI